MFTKEITKKLKGISILLLIFHHLFRITERISGKGIELKLLKESTLVMLAGNARICVWIFAFLSAYGLQKSIPEDQHLIGKWYIQRIVKLLIPFQITALFLFLISFLLTPSYTPLQVYRNFGEVLLDLFGLSDLYGTSTFGGVWWYMSFALLEILIMPVLDKLIACIGIAVFPLSCILLKYVIHSGIHSTAGGDYAMYLLIVELGGVLAKYEILDKLKVYYSEQSFRTKFLVIGLMIILAGWLPYFSNYSLKSDLVVTKQIFRTIAAVAIILIGYLVRFPKLIEKWLLFLGELSGIIYFVHWYIYAKLPATIYWSSNVFYVFISCLGVSVIFALIIKQFQEYIEVKI